jgi:hypothetical protein
MRLHGLFRQEELLSDLAVDESVGDELEHLDLARRRLLLQLSQDRRWREGYNRAGALRVPASSSRLESAAVVAVSVQDLSTLRGVHAMRIGGAGIAL